MKKPNVAHREVSHRMAEAGKREFCPNHPGPGLCPSCMGALKKHWEIFRRVAELRAEKNGRIATP